MLFSSITFLYYFLPIMLAIYLIVPAILKLILNRFMSPDVSNSWSLAVQNGILRVFSRIFYGWGEPVYLILMVMSIASGYVFGLLIEKFRGGKGSRICLIISVALSLAMLGYFKYADFFIENVNSVTGLGIPMLRIALPIGISFYTFQIISYVADIYRGQAQAQRNIINFGAYVSMFPQLIAGPIVRYTDVAAQLKDRSITAEGLYCGACRFIVGLAKKLLISNRLGMLCNVFRESDEKSVVFYWLYAVAFTLHIYFDFSGYSDMAIGLGKILGFSFPENFNYPYISHSVTEFWRRWHMSLGSWFRDYVYIPLGGNRVSKLCHVRNILVVWLLTGLWHGAEWNFVCWGLMFAVLLLVEKTWLSGVLSKIPHAVSSIYVMFFVTLSFVIFNADGMVQAISDIGGMFGGGVPLMSDETGYYLRSFGVLIALSIFGCTPIVHNLAEKARNSERLGVIMSAAEPIVMIILLLAATAYLVDGSFNPFLYFRF